MIFPWRSTGFPELDQLARDAEFIYQWALKHGDPAPLDNGKLGEWAVYSVTHNRSANAVAQSLPSLAAAAWTIAQDSDALPESLPIPALTVLVAEYLAIAAKALIAHDPSTMQTALALATSTINLARQAMDFRVRKDGQSEGGRLRQTQGKDDFLKEADAMLERGLSKSNVAKRLHEKYDIPVGTVRDWLKNR